MIGYIMKNILLGILIKAERAIKNRLVKLREWCLRPLLLRLGQQEGTMKMLVDAGFRTRAMIKLEFKKPIRVLFICHEPTLWGMFESVYNAMDIDLDFSPLVISLPYRHPTLPEGQYKDAGMLEFCIQRKIKAVQGYDKKRDEWLNPVTLVPDYVFFQSPYHLFPPMWSVERLSTIARVCHIPYGITIFRGKIYDVVHPAKFFRFISLFFKENSLSIKLFTDRFMAQGWFDHNKVILSGYPKLDYLNESHEICHNIWRHGTNKDIKRILWTPRWTTSEGACHFFNYKDFFSSFCKDHPNVEFVFRPHPLCLQNFLKTGELTRNDLEHLKAEYENSFNMTLDETGDYRDTFLTSDILITDISSLMTEYYVTGKPIIYTHCVDMFNDLGRQLSEGFYWVKSSIDLERTLEMLISGNDPLKKKRTKILKTLFFMPKGGAGLQIKEAVRSDLLSCTIDYAPTSNNNREVELYSAISDRYGKDSQHTVTNHKWPLDSLTTN